MISSSQIATTHACLRCGGEKISCEFRMILALFRYTMPIKCQSLKVRSINLNDLRGKPSRDFDPIEIHTRHLVSIQYCEPIFL